MVGFVCEPGLTERPNTKSVSTILGEFTRRIKPSLVVILMGGTGNGPGGFGEAGDPVVFVVSNVKKIKMSYHLNYQIQITRIKF